MVQQDLMKRNTPLLNTIIFIIDSENGLESGLKERLQKYTKDVLSCDYGSVASIISLQESPNIILLSYESVKNEISFLKNIQKRHPKSDIVVAGKKPDDEALLQLLRIGVKGFFKDDINIDDLEKYIFEIASTHEQHENISGLELKAYDILDMLGSMIVMTDGAAIEYANKSFLDFVYLDSFEEFSQKYAYTFDLSALIVKINDKIIKENDEWIKYLIQSNNTFNVSYLHDIHENTSTAFLTKLTRLPGHKSCYIVSFTDITKLEEDKQKLKSEIDSSMELNFLINEKLEELRQKEQFVQNQARMVAMGEMLNNIIHQWKQPLTSISMMLYNLDDSREYGELTDEELKSAIKKMHSQIEYMTNTVNDFRGFLNPSKKKSVFDLCEAIEKTIFLVQNHFASRAIIVEFKYDGEREIECFGYPNEFKQVVLNILNNSKDAIVEQMEKDISKNEGRIKISLQNDEKYGIIAIEDDGGGIDEKYLPKIFDQYFTTKDIGGTGIGLYMSRVIIEENMGGKIEVCNTEAGAMFKIHIPLQK